MESWRTIFSSRRKFFGGGNSWVFKTPGWYWSTSLKSVFSQFMFLILQKLRCFLRFICFAIAIILVVLWTYNLEHGCVLRFWSLSFWMLHFLTCFVNQWWQQHLLEVVFTAVWRKVIDLQQIGQVSLMFVKINYI